MKTGFVLSACMASFSVVLGACVGTPAAFEPAAVSTDPAHHGYLTRSELQHLADAVPPPPPTGSQVEAADRALSASYRVLENTDRWLMATSHAEVRSPFALQHFDCALGVLFNPAENTTPASARLMQRLFEDAEAASTIVKMRAHRPRPVGDDPNREACQRVSDTGRASASYPSGSATVAAAYGEGMAAIAPDHAEAARDPAHQIALSRVICGMHYPLDAQTGEQLGKAVFERAAITPGFQADLALARQEYVSLKASGKTNPGCAAERAALLQTP